MDIYVPEDLPSFRETLRMRLLRGAIAILPTDTIYGLSGNALDPQVVARIHRLKKKTTPSSFIPHSLEWARLLVDERQAALFDASADSFRGAYTTFWKYAGRSASLPRSLTSSGLVGMRLPDHWITEFTRSLRAPLVTTSVNVHGAPYMTCLDDLPESIRKGVDFIVYEGRRAGPPSTIVHCCEGLPFRYEERA